jgi:hypothetical protein
MEKIVVPNGVRRSGGNPVGDKYNQLEWKKMLK